MRRGAVVYQGIVLRGPLPSLRPLDALLGACLLASAALLVTADESRDAVMTHRDWASAWTWGGAGFFLAALRSKFGVIGGMSGLSSPLWLLAGIAGAALLGGHALDVLAASSLEMSLDGPYLPAMTLGDSILLAALIPPALLVWTMKSDRGGVPPVRFLGLVGLCVLGTVLATVLLDGGARKIKPTFTEPSASLVWTLMPLGWMVVAYAFDGARSRVLRLDGAGGLLAGCILGFCVLPSVTVMRRPLGLRTLDDRGLFELLVGRGLGNYGSEIASVMEASLCAFAAAALLTICLRNAIYGLRALPGIVGVALPVVVVLVQARVPTDKISTAALILGWTAVLVGVPFSGKVRSGDR